MHGKTGKVVHSVLCIICIAVTIVCIKPEKEHDLSGNVIVEDTDSQEITMEEASAIASQSGGHNTDGWRNRYIGRWVPCKSICRCQNRTGYYC